jgi:hypothetical protein
MTIQFTDEQWATISREAAPVRVSDPSHQATFVLLDAELYDRFRSLFEADPVTAQERQFQLQEFGRRAGWDDPAMDIYADLDPRNQK